MAKKYHQLPEQAYRNAVHTESGAIDLEINHPRFGWIPFTASPDDQEDYGREIFNQMSDKAQPYSPASPEQAKNDNQGAV